MSNSSDFKTLDYLNLDIKNPENYSRCRKTTAENNKIICNFKENYNHKLHSTSNDKNFEQLNTTIDLLCNLSENIKNNLDKLSKPTEFRTKINTSENLVYLKELLEDIFKTTKNESKNLFETVKHLEQELIKNNKLLETILYGKYRN